MAEKAFVGVGAQCEAESGACSTGVWLEHEGVGGVLGVVLEGVPTDGAVELEVGVAVGSLARFARRVSVPRAYPGVGVLYCNMLYPCMDSVAKL